MNVSIYSISGKFYEAKEVDHCSFPSVSGEFSIYPRHVAIISILKRGSVVVHLKDGNKKEFEIPTWAIASYKNGEVSVVFMDGFDKGNEYENF